MSMNVSFNPYSSNLISNHKQPSFAGSYQITCSQGDVSNKLMKGVNSAQSKYGQDIQIVGGAGKYYLLTGQEAKDERILKDIIKKSDLMILCDGKEPVLSEQACTAVNAINDHFYKTAQKIDLKI